MLRNFTKVVSLGLVTLLLALPMVALGEQTAAITNAPAGVSTEWGDTVPVTVTMTDENGDVLEGTLDVATADVESFRFAGTVTLSYEYGATNMPANILYHALLGLNEGALIYIEGDSLENKVAEPGIYTVTYTYDVAEDKTEDLVCTVLVRGAISANVAILDYEVPLGDSSVGPRATDAPAVAEEDEVEEEAFEEPVPVVVVED